MEISERERFERFWRESANEDLETAEDLFKLKKFSACLFFCHLAIEKILKALVIEATDSYPPAIHDLVKLAQKAKIAITKTQEKQLDEITSFNIEARYDVIKDKLYKKATKEYTNKYLKVTQNFFKFFHKST